MKKNKKMRVEREFEKRLRELLVGRGAQENRLFLWSMYPLVLETTVGPLLVHGHGNWVAMRFVDLERAKALLPHGRMDPLNPYSGKYNTPIFTDAWSVEDRIREVERMLDAVGVRARATRGEADGMVLHARGD
jgi:hypothetical protein